MGTIPSQVDTITLDGYEYALDIPGQVQGADSPHKMYPQKLIQDEGQGNTFWKEWLTSSWHMGERYERVLADETSYYKYHDEAAGYRYHDALGLDEGLLSKWGQLRLAPAMTKSLTLASAHMPMTVNATGNKLIVGYDSGIKLWTYSGGWANASSVVGSGAVTDLLTAGAALYGVRNGAVITSADGGSTWTAVGSYTTATGVAYVNSELYVGKSDGVYNHTASESISSEPVTAICNYREMIYHANDRRIWRYDARADYIYDELPEGFTITALVPYRQILLILGYFSFRGIKRGAVYYMISGSENHLYSLNTNLLPTNYDTTISAAAGSDDEIFFANPARGGADRYDLGVSGLTNGPGKLGNVTIPFKAMAMCEGYLFIGVGNNGVYIADTRIPTAWETSGWLTTAEYDFGWHNDAKVFGSIYVEHKALLTGESIKVEYSLDHGATYSTAGTSSTVGGTSSFFSLPYVKGVTLKMRFTLTGPGTSSPTLTKAVVRAAACTEDSWLWDLRIKVIERWGGKEARAALKASVNKQTALAFTDVDGTAYTVVVDACQVASEPDPNQDTAVIAIRLRTV